MVTIWESDKNCSADKIVAINGGINYEVVCTVRERIPRIYYQSKKFVGYSDMVEGYFMEDLVAEPSIR